MRKSRFGSFRFRVLFFLTVLFYIPIDAAVSGLKIAAGPFFSYNFYGQPGIRLTVAHNKLLNGHPQVMLSYTTSRISWWNGPYALATDELLMNVSWAFRHDKLVVPYAGVDMGYLRFDREDDERFARLQNSFFALNARTGVRCTLLDGKLQPSIDAGYVVLQNSITFPFFIGIGVCYTILRGVN